MNKSYEIKAYSIAWVFKTTLQASKRKNDINISSNINWPQGELNIELNLWINDTLWFSHSDILKVYSYSDVYPNWKLIFTWQVQNIVKQYWENIQSINISCFWLWTLLNELLFYSSSFVFSKNQDPSTTIKNIIDYFNSVYTFWWLSYTATSIVNYWSSVNIDFDYTNCYKAIDDTAKTTNFWYFIDEDWTVYFKDKPATATHKLTVQKDIQSIIVNETSQDVINSVLVEYKTWTTWAIEDSTSITTYWKKQEKVSQTELWDIWSATTFANNYLLKNKDKKIQTTIIVNDSYLYNWLTIEDIKPWDTITVLNFPIEINNLQVQKINYNSTQISIDLDYFLSIWKLFIL